MVNEAYPNRANEKLMKNGGTPGRPAGKVEVWKPEHLEAQWL
jgi:hypothetical protein